MENKIKKQSIMKGAMILSIGAMTSRVIGLLYRIPIQYIIGDEGNGLYGSAYQVYKVILTLTAIAMPAALSKLIAEREAVGAYRESDRVYKITLGYSMMVALICAAIIGFGADIISDFFFPGENIGMPIRVLAPTVLIATCIASLRGYFQGLNNMVPTALSQIIEQIVNVAASVGLAYYLMRYSLLAGVTGSTMGTGLGAAVALTILGVLYMKNYKGRKELAKQPTTYQPESRKVILKKVLGIMIPIMISTSVFSIMTFIDLSMISKVLPSTLEKLKAAGQLQAVPVPDAVNLPISLIKDKLKGQFNFQYGSFIDIPVALVLQVAAASIPAISAAMAVGKQDEVRNKIRVIFKGGLILAAPCSMAFFLFGKPIIALIVKGGTGGELLSAGAVGLLFITLAQLSAAMLQGMGEPKIASINSIIACIIKIGVNLVLVSMPSLHIYGIIHSTTICYFIYAFLNLSYLKKHYNVTVEWKEALFKPIICAVIMGVISYPCYLGLLAVLPMAKLAMLLVVPIAVIVYLLAGILTKTITPEDISGLPGGKKLVKVLDKVPFINKNNV